jgi:CRISPR-associated protein Cas1
MTGPSLARVAGVGALTAAWRHVLANDSADDILSAGVRRFAEDVDGHLLELGQQLSAGTYQPGRLSLVQVPKDDGELRTLLIPPARDRVVERSVHTQLTPLIDPLLGPGSFGFRPGLGVGDAVQALAGLRAEGFRWVWRADIDDCFPSIDRDRVGRILDHLVDDPALRALLTLLLHRIPARPGAAPARAARGLAQGSPLSPLLANLVLEHVDERLRRAGFPIVRYCDDIAVTAHSRAEAEQAGQIVATAAREIGMSVGAEAAAMSFDEGFTFLGEDFGPRYPPLLDQRTEAPDRRTLFLGVAGSRARIDEGRVVIEHVEQHLLDVPAGLVARIVCFGPVGISAGLRSWGALATGIEMVFCSHRGRYLGHIVEGTQPGYVGLSWR